jgi:hypothetical protein
MEVREVIEIGIDKLVSPEYQGLIQIMRKRPAKAVLPISI